MKSNCEVRPGNYSGPVRALTLVTALCALVAAGCGSGAGEEAVPVTTPTETLASPEASSRPPAPAIDGVSLEGEPISLADSRGQPVLVNVWSSW